MADAEVKFYLEKVLVTIENATQKALEKMAYQMEAQTKVNIQQNDQIDTGFMMNSTYIITPSGDTAGNTWTSGAVYSNKAGEKVRRIRAPMPGLGDAAAAVVVGAEYAVYQEAKNSFLLRAGEQVADQAGGIAEPVYRELVRD